jgi:LuxR family maltose regulon positive regulatory protein
MRQHFPHWMRVENTMRIYQWFESFPKEFLQAEPWLCVVHAWMIWRLGKAEETGRCLQVAQSALDGLHAANQFPYDDPEYTSLQAEIFAFQGLIASQTDDPQGAEALALKALASAPEDAPVVRAIAHMVLASIYRNRGELELALRACEAGLEEALLAGETGTIVSVYQNLGGILLIQANLSRAGEVYQQALEYAERKGQAHYPAYGLIRMRMADLYYQRNQLDEAEKWLTQGLERVNFASNWWGMIYGRYVLSLIQSARGQQQALQQTFRGIEEIVPKISGAYFAEHLNTLLILVRARLGLQPATVPRNMVLEITQDVEPDTAQFERLIMQVKAQCLLGDSENLAEVLAWLENIAIRRGYVFWLIEIFILEAITWQKQGKRQAACASLAKALDLAEPEAILRPFLDGGEPVKAILKAVEFKMANADHQSFISGLQTAFNIELPPQIVSPPTHSGLLSKREIELLCLIAAGRSNKEIAAELVISIGTVKRHTVNIFTKLDVKNRTEAVAKARELGLL